MLKDIVVSSDITTLTPSSSSGVPWYDRSASAHPSGLIAGRDYKYGSGSGYQDVYMIDRQQGERNWHGKFRGRLKRRGFDLLLPTLVVASNDGQEIAPLASAGPVVGLDISHSAVQLGAQQFGDRMSFINASAAELPFGDNSFGNIVFLRAYQVLKPKEKEAYLNEAKRVARPGAHMVVSVANCFFDVDKGQVINGYHVPDPKTGVDRVDRWAISRDVRELKAALGQHPGYDRIRTVKTPAEVFVYATVVK